MSESRTRTKRGCLRLFGVLLALYTFWSLWTGYLGPDSVQTWGASYAGRIASQVLVDRELGQAEAKGIPGYLEMLQRPVPRSLMRPSVGSDDPDVAAGKKLPRELDAKLRERYWDDMDDFFGDYLVRNVFEDHYAWLYRHLSLRLWEAKSPELIAWVAQRSDVLPPRRIDTLIAMDSYWGGCQDDAFWVATRESWRRMSRGKNPYARAEALRWAHFWTEDWQEERALYLGIVMEEEDPFLTGALKALERHGVPDPELETTLERLASTRSGRLSDVEANLTSQNAVAALDAMHRKAAERENRARRREQIRESLHVSATPNPGPGVDRTTFNLPGGVSLDLVLIPAGRFLMGSPPGEHGQPNERPQHVVHISKPFYLAATPTTRAQSRAVLEPHGVNPRPEGADLPAENVSRAEAEDFCGILAAVTGLTVRLPTEAEWEYACRAGTATAFCTGDSITTDQANFDGRVATPLNPAGLNRNSATPVRVFPPNAWGLFDLHGNVVEMCLESGLRPFTSEEVTDPIGSTRGDGSVVRGGSTRDEAFYCRSAFRIDDRFSPAGFRIAVEVPTSIREAGQVPRP